MRWINTILAYFSNASVVFVYIAIFVRMKDELPVQF